MLYIRYLMKNAMLLCVLISGVRIYATINTGALGIINQSHNIRTANNIPQANSNHLIEDMRRVDSTGTTDSMHRVESTRCADNILIDTKNTLLTRQYLNKTIDLKNFDSFVHRLYTLSQSTDADWLIVGAGPAGMVTVGMLLDIGVAEDRIIWVDPEFSAGRIGQYYAAVPANNHIKGFIDFINACKTFGMCDSPEVQYIKNLDPNGFDNLGLLIEPLKCITEYMRTRVRSIQDNMVGLYFENDVWHVQLKNGDVVSSTHVILATGSHPKTLPYDQHKVIPLDLALNPTILRTMVNEEDVVGVFGSSHSGILLLKFLSEMPVKYIYNFYMQDLLYAIDMGHWVMNEISGLKGITADWARNVLEKNPPHNLERVKIQNDTLATVLPQCSKIIYAVGYERNELPEIYQSALGNYQPINTYNEKNGFIAPRLFGIGIAFPEKYVDAGGYTEYCVGLGCFIEYAQSMVPQWADDSIYKYIKGQVARAQCAKFKKMEQLFKIYVL